MDQDELKEMLGNYLKDQSEEIDSALKAKDTNKIQQIGHKIKGNSGSIALGLNDINKLGQQLEEAYEDTEKVKELQSQILEQSKELGSTDDTKAIPKSKESEKSDIPEEPQETFTLEKSDDSITPDKSQEFAAREKPDVSVPPATPEKPDESVSPKEPTKPAEPSSSDGLTPPKESKDSINPSTKE